MDKTDFLAFLNATTSKGTSTFNLKTQNVSKQARDILQKTEYKALAKAHINSNVKNAYYNNAKFKAKLDEVMAQYNITVVA